MALQSSQRLPELLFYTKKSYRILQLQFYKGIHPPYTIHIQPTCAHYTTSREFSIQNPILHAEDKELFKYYYYILRAKRPSFQKRNSIHRRQGDLLEIHSCVPDIPDIPVFPDIPDIPVFPVFPDIPVFPVFPDIPDIPVVPDTPETFRTFQLFMTFQPFQAILQFYKVPVSPGNPPHYSILQLECIFYSSIGFHRNSTKYQLNNTNYKHSTNITFFKERELL